MNSINKTIEEELSSFKSTSVDNIDEIIESSARLKDNFDIESENFNNIKFQEEPDGNKLVSTDDGFFVLPFKQDNLLFMDSKRYVQFIKKVELLVRTHPDYKKYISHLKEHGLNHCMILGDLDDADCSIEMHHGPILNLFDYCSIITTYLFKTVGTCTTFEVADIVLEEHRQHNVQIVMLTTTMHQMIEAKNLFISPKQSFGRLDKFIEKYRIAIPDSQIYVIKKYLEIAEARETNVDDELNLRETIKNYSHYNS